jgi:uncharacterized protein YjlB
VGATDPQLPQQHVFADDGVFPNSRLPVLVYRRALAAPTAAGLEQLFERNGWSSAWRNGLYSVHHYHSTAHEVLGIYQGRVSARLGGPGGTTVTLEAGDIVIIPAGVAHKNDGASADFRVVGAYPAGTGPDMQYGKAGERPATDRNITHLPLPPHDPLHGPTGPLPTLWRQKSSGR